MNMAYFECKGCVQRNLYLNCESLRKGFEGYSDIVCFVSGACNLKTHWPECVGRLNRTFCFTGAIDALQGAVVRRPISA